MGEIKPKLDGKSRIDRLFPPGVEIIARNRMADDNETVYGRIRNGERA